MRYMVAVIVLETQHFRINDQESVSGFVNWSEMWNLFLINKIE